MKALEKLNKFFELPDEIVFNVPKITIAGKLISIENYKYMISFETSRISINTTIGILKIEGKDFEIKGITKEEILIDGILTKLEFF